MWFSLIIRCFVGEIVVKYVEEVLEDEFKILKIWKNF